MLRNRLIYLTALIAVTVFFGFFYAWFSEFLWYLVLALPLISLLVSIPAMLRLELTTEAPPSVPRGNPVQLHLRTHCFLPRPRCRFRLRVTLYQSGQSKTYKVRPSSHHMLLDIPTAHSGQILCGVDKAWVYDYLGLFRFPRRWKQETEILVLPQAAPPAQLPGITQLAPVVFRSKPGGFSEYHELRDYRPGDSMRQIHWKLTAKADRAIVRDPQEPEHKPILLTLDLPMDLDLLDRVLDHTLFMSGWLLEADCPHLVRWISGSQVVTHPVHCPEDLPGLTAALCRSSSTEPGQTVIENLLSYAWHYHILPTEPGP